MINNTNNFNGAPLGGTGAAAGLPSQEKINLWLINWCKHVLKHSPKPLSYRYLILTVVSPSYLLQQAIRVRAFVTHQETNETLGVKYPVQLQVNVEKSESDESTKVIREGGLLRQDFVLIRGAFWLACSEANIFTSIDNCRWCTQAQAEVFSLFTTLTGSEEGALFFLNLVKDTSILFVLTQEMSKESEAFDDQLAQVVAWNQNDLFSSGQPAETDLVEYCINNFLSLENSLT